MSNEMPFGLIGLMDDGEVRSFIVHDEVVYVHKNRRTWEQCSDYPFPADRFSDVVEESIKQDLEAAKRFQYVKKESSLRLSVQINDLVDELRWRYVATDNISFVMNPSTFDQAAQGIAYNIEWMIESAKQEMLGKQALVVGGAFIPTRFTKFLPGFKTNALDIREILVVADVSPIAREVEIYNRKK